MCREIYNNFKNEIPNVNISKIINYLDKNDELKQLVKKRINHTQTLIWQNYKN